MEKLNLLFLYIIHSFYYMIGSIIIYMYIGDSILNTTLNYEYIAIFTLIFNFVILAASDHYEEKMNIDLYKDKLFIVINLTACIFTALLCSFVYGLFAVVFTAGYFIVISMIILKMNRLHTSIYIKVAKSVGLILVLSSIYVVDKRILLFGNNFVGLISIYFVVIIFYVICFNFNEHYDTKNSINKNRNLFIFNFFVAAFITMFTFFRNELIYLFNLIKNYVEPAIDSFLDSATKALNSFMNKFFNTDFMNFVNERMSKMSKSTEKNMPETPEEVAEILEKVSETADFSVIYNVLLVILLIGLIAILYKSVGNYSHKKTKKKSFEEKEFVFEKGDFLNNLKNNIISKFKKKEKISKERLMYKNAVKQLIEEGYKITGTTTPNEYIDTIAENDIKRYDFKKITSDYNAYRYGKDDI